MTSEEFAAADRSGLGPVTITFANNPDPKTILAKEGVSSGLSILKSNLLKIYVWDGASAIYLNLDATRGGSNFYSIVPCTQDATEFAALLND